MIIMKKLLKIKKNRYKKIGRKLKKEHKIETKKKQKKKEI